MDKLRPLTELSYKRILVISEELYRYHITQAKIYEFFEYFFNISEARISRILTDYDLCQFEHIKLTHIEMDFALVEMFAKKVLAQAAKDKNLKLKKYAK